MASLSLHGRSCAAWIARTDPDRSRRYKGIRLICAYGLGALLGSWLGVRFGLASGVPAGFIAGNFALWASVSEVRPRRSRGLLDLALLCLCATVGATLYIGLAGWLPPLGHSGPEAILVSGAFLVGFLKRYGVSGAGAGSQIYIGELLACGTDLAGKDLPVVWCIGLCAAIAAVVPRLLIGPRQAPDAAPSAIAMAATTAAGAPLASLPKHAVPLELVMGLQAAIGALAVVLLDAFIGLEQPAWAITACTYVIANTASGTRTRARQRMVGTWVGVLAGLACLPLAEHLAPLAWGAAAMAMMVYALTLAERYDIACGAFAFTLVVTLAASGEHSAAMLASRAWETMIGSMLGLLTARFVFPLKEAGETAGAVT